jgi:hypothetical protein
MLWPLGFWPLASCFFDQRLAAENALSWVKDHRLEEVQGVTEVRESEAIRVEFPLPFAGMIVGLKSPPFIEGVGQVAEDFLQLSSYLNFDLYTCRHWIPLRIEQFCFKGDVGVKGIIAIVSLLRVSATCEAEAVGVSQPPTAITRRPAGERSSSWTVPNPGWTILDRLKAAWYLCCDKRWAVSKAANERAAN